MPVTKTADYFSNTLKKQTFGLIIGLSIQYLLGIYANLYIQFPQRGDVGQFWGFAWRQLPIAAHIIIGIALLLGSIGLLIRSIKQKKKKWIIVASIGAVAILAAGLSGSRFIPTQQNGYSLSMAISFIIAVLAYSWSLYNEKN